MRGNDLLTFILPSRVPINFLFYNDMRISLKKTLNLELLVLLLLETQAPSSHSFRGHKRYSYRLGNKLNTTRAYDVCFF